MSLYSLGEAHPSFAVDQNQGLQSKASLQNAAIRNSPAKPQSLNALNPYSYQQAPSWYTSPRGPPYHARCLETFESTPMMYGNAGMDHSSSDMCHQMQAHASRCGACRRQSLNMLANDFMFYLLLGAGLLFISKRM